MNENDLKDLGLLSDDDIKAIAAETDQTKKATLQKEALKKGVEAVTNAKFDREKEEIKKQVEKSIQDGTHKGTQKNLTTAFKDLLTPDELNALNGKQTKDYIEFLASKVGKFADAKVEDFKKTLPADAKEIATKYQTLAAEYDQLKAKASNFDTDIATKLAEQEKELKEKFSLQLTLQNAVSTVLPHVLDGMSSTDIIAMFDARAGLKMDNGKIVVVGKDGKLIPKDERSNYGEDITGFLSSILKPFTKKSNGTNPAAGGNPQNGIRPIAPSATVY